MKMLKVKRCVPDVQRYTTDQYMIQIIVNGDYSTNRMA